MNNNMEISKPRFSADALFPLPRIYSFIYPFLTIIANQNHRETNEKKIFIKSVYIFTSKKSIFRHLEIGSSGPDANTRLRFQ